MSDTTKKDRNRYGEYKAGYSFMSATARSDMSGKTFGCSDGPAHDNGHRGQAKGRRESMRIVRGKIRAHEKSELGKQVDQLFKGNEL